MAVDDAKIPSKYEAVGDPVFSPDSRRMAFIASDEPGRRMIVDGIPSEEYGAVSGFTFSPDSKRVAFLGWEGGKARLVVDGIPGEKLDGDFFLAPVFSPDGKRIAVAGVTGEHDHAWLYIDDKRIGTKERPKFDDIGEVVFGPDSTQYAYNASRRGKWVCVTDGREGPEFEAVSAPEYSPDGKHLAYIGMTGNRLYEVVDGQTVRERALPAGKARPVAHRRDRSGDPLRGLLTGDIILANVLVYDSEPQRLVYLLTQGGGQYAQRVTDRAKRKVVVDGREGKEYDVAGIDLRVSPDRLHVAYVVRDLKADRGDKALVVLDEVEGRPYDDVFSMGFAADNSSVSYIARDGRRILRVTQHVSP